MELLSSASVLAVAHFCFIFFLSSVGKSRAQNATTDPSEVRALISIFQQWDIQGVDSWNISGEPCTGPALSQDIDVFSDPSNNPSITCDCTFNNATTCHITRLRVYALNRQKVLTEELLAFKFLTLLWIDQNYLTGPLPAWIGNLSTLRVLALAQNALSGPIPKELGNLKELTVLSIALNNFSGRLPPELGNLVKLEQLYISSCGVDGEIPSTFVNLVNMQTMWASDNSFTGKIPYFIGNWKKLTSLRFEGNSFEGPIPSSFSKLTSLNSLRINGLSNVSSSLDFVRNLKNLTDLILRNALITGSIPSDIGELQSLQKLDLSFNNLTGQIPSALFNISPLTYLFLGNNSLSGTIPSQKSENLMNIDLSYNFLSGSFPSWVDANIQLNLVANNFTFSRSNISLLPGLHCLQRSFQCNRNSPHYTKFSIKCGGPEMTADGIKYEAENSSLGTASFNVISTEKWAVSNVGLFSDRKNITYVQNTSAQVRYTNSPELFQSSRISPGSLRYYGLGLENGPYTVKLLFAETAFDDRSTQTWKSLGRRIFDIYIQGTIVLKDFDISKAAGGVERAITKNFNAIVTENYLEIHLFWAGKGTCCIPERGYYGSSISAINVVSNFTPAKENWTGMIVGVSVPVGVVTLTLILTFVAFYLRWRKDDDEEELLGIGPRPDTFSYIELRVATDDFSPSNKLGEGGFGPVYKGKLYDGRVVAVKQLSVASHQGKSQFVTEIATISAVQHRNLVKLYGCCIEGKRRLLVYEYLENRSLDQALFGNKDLHLDWPTRFSICLATARGLAYLHEESRLRIVHRDVKASNILLDAELCPKISDFGLAKLYDDKKTHISTRVAGTIGYLAPEYAMRGHLTEKADVFGFGVVALEIVSGRPNSDNSQEIDKIYLLEWAWTLYESNQCLGLVDPTLVDFDENEALRVIRVGLLCTQTSPMMRPAMSRVIAMLVGDIEVSPDASKPSYLTDLDFKDITASIKAENTPSTGSEHSDNKNKNSLNPGIELVPSPLNITEFSDIIAEGR
ncbi:hypothetical protein SLEP1_g56841 [Rubroshorea leprosula]|uniref:non-specific serine/threonine protein kinase n=1 Tax=Rubroshorea leprosula TaxID=152421 RepID=A0AAV5MLV1_9ROSI|nr:hypothetical protein SLEP1_g56841 [Rubroshorea leprosula]